jgi:hypothetical protein
METYLISEDIKVFYVKAKSFPEGIEEAHVTILGLLPSANGRNLFGISSPSGKEGIVYKAAIEEAYDKEAEKYNCATVIIKKGYYTSEIITNWDNDKEIVQKTFKKLLAHPEIDKNGYCLEIYLNDKDMICLVPLDSGTVLFSREQELLAEIRDCFRELKNTIAAFKNEQYNSVPFQGSWTPGQIIEHIIKFASGIPDNHTEFTHRQFDEKMEPVRQLFLNFSIKMHSPDFVQPGNPTRDKMEAFRIFNAIQDRLERTIKTADLTVTCLDFEMPVFGNLTRYEWLKFILFHTQRHIHQLKNILTLINGN